MTHTGFNSMRVIIFDLDETLLFTQQLHNEAWKAWCKDTIGDEEVMFEYYRTYRSDATRRLCEDFDIDLLETITWVHEWLCERITQIPVPAETVRLLEQLHARGHTLGALTHSTHAYALALLRHANVLRFMIPELILGIDSVGYLNKTGPWSYPQLLARVTDPCDVIMVEDSPKNLITAKRWGMTTIHVGEHSIGEVAEVDCHFNHVDDLMRAIIEGCPGAP